MIKALGKLKKRREVLDLAKEAHMFKKSLVSLRGNGYSQKSVIGSGCSISVLQVREISKLGRLSKFGTNKCLVVSSDMQALIISIYTP